jgi:YHS domain-containing protein
MRLGALAIIASLTLFAISLTTFGAKAESTLAIGGYDPVAYFTEGQPTIGNPQFEYEVDGAIYRFASARHLELFEADPDRYLPQYQTWCAASVSKGIKVHGDPHYWLISDDRLFLFGGPAGPDAMRADKGMKAKADQNWLTVSQLPDPPLSQ